MTRKYRVHLDTGCSGTTFPIAFASELGIDPNACATISGTTANGPDTDPATLPRLWQPGVEAIFQGERIRLQALFRHHLVPILLGREDFLNYYKVAIDHRAKTLSLERYP